ncbi:RagB/SusD family nutrient uptake outer membrane protein [Puteibacter caeruleilacunae]|nr:RagB/SusD family nutrient uptake outer membrane protein [Puteibacter caeruleilacunae]
MNKIYLILLLFWVSFTACDDYLDVVPDNVATVDHAFKDRTSAEKYLATCYSYMPNLGHPIQDPALLGSDEWWAIEDSYYDWHGQYYNALHLRFGMQNSNEPLLNYWDGSKNGKPLYKAIRDCNVFLDNIDNVGPDLEAEERMAWIGEVKFLKAYYHYFLLRMYGPIPLIRENLPVSVGIDESRTEREHFDVCVDYIISLLDEAAENLPLEIQNRSTDLGHITKPAVLTLKADVLLTAASPLFNGNEDLFELTNENNESLFPAYDAQKWTKAAEACKLALETALQAGHEFYDFDLYADISDTTKLLMDLKQVVSERWNSEIVWTMSNLSMNYYYKSATPYFFKSQVQWVPYDPYMCPTLSIIESFYSKNGVPIEEDNTFAYDNRFDVTQVPDDHLYYAEPGYKTMELNLNREARYYANIAFDGGVWFGNGRYKEIGDGDPDETSWIFKMKAGEDHGRNGSFRYSLSGFWAKKPSHIENVSPNSGSHAIDRSTFPIYRLADLYLMYAEALNESLDAPNDEVYNAINAVRERAGLPTVQDSWTNFSLYPEKINSKEGMREIIRHERTNELAFEGKRFWDIRRWKIAHEVMNEPVKGLNANGENLEDFNVVRTLGLQSFSSKEYLWPISVYNLRVNTKIKQNPGW